MNCIVLSILLNYQICIIKLWMGSVYARKHQQICKICSEKTLLYSDLFWKGVKIMYNYLYIVGWERKRCFFTYIHWDHFVLTPWYAVFVQNKWIISQMNIYATHLYIFWFDFLSESFLRYSFIHFKYILIHFTTWRTEFKWNVGAASVKLTKGNLKI